jgi:hypothetical protein
MAKTSGVGRRIRGWEGEGEGEGEAECYYGNRRSVHQVTPIVKIA